MIWPDGRKYSGAYVNDKNKVLGHFNGLMEQYILANGIKENSMVLGWLPMESQNMENGLMEDEFVASNDKELEFIM